MPGGRGRKKTHKGGHRHFTNADELKKSEEKAEKEKEWKRRQGLLPSSDEESDEEGAAAPKSKDKDDGIAFEEDSSSEESEEEKELKPKGVSALIEVENPNRIVKKSKKVEELQTGDNKPQLSRKEREEVEKQQAKERYRQLHMAGKTDEARADLARLALIRKQREDAAKKRDVEKLEKEKADKAAEAKLKERRAAKQ